MAGAVHRLQGVDGLFAGMVFVHFHDEHILLVFFPVARGLPKTAVNHLRGVNFYIAAILLTAAHVILQRRVYAPPIGVPKHLTWGLFLHMEQVHLAAQAAVVALFGFFQESQMRLEVIAVFERDPIDALQHRAVAVAAPICACEFHQFKRISGQLPCVLQMRATAEVLPIPVPIHPHGLIFGDHPNQFYLIWFACCFVMGDCACAIPDFCAHGIAGVDDLFHLRLNPTQIIWGEGLFAVEIVIPAIFDDGADCHFYIWPDFLNGARHHMGKVVTDQL